MTSDPFLNIFAAYRRGNVSRGVGEGRATAKEAARMRALEDNVTRAFLSTLHHLSPGLRNRLLERTVARACAVSPPGSKSTVDVYLQKKPPADVIERACAKALLVVRAFGSWPVETHTDPAHQGRPDGWLVWDGVCVCIESKLLSLPDPQNQLRPHAKVLGIPYRAGDERTLTWERIEGAARAIAGQCATVDSAKDAFLLRSLADFLVGEGLGRLGTEHRALMAGLQSDSEPDAIERARVPFRKICSEFNAGLAKPAWTAKFNRTPYVEIYAVRRDHPMAKVSLNICAGVEPTGEISYFLSAHAYTEYGYTSLLRRLKAGAYDELSRRLGRQPVLVGSVVHRDGAPLNWRGPDETDVEAEKGFDIHAVEAKVKQVKKKVRKRIGISGRRLSVVRHLDDEFLSLGSFEEQLAVLKGEVRHFEDVLG